MLETMDKVLLAGLGALSMSRKRAEEIFDDLVRKGQAAKGGRSGFVNDVIDTAEKAKKDLEDLVARQAHQAVAKLDLAAKDDLARVERKLDQLLGRKVKPARTKPKTKSKPAT